MKGNIEIEMMERQLDRVQSFIPRIDARVSSLFAITSGQIALSLINLSVDDLDGWFMVLCLLIFLTCAAWTVVNLYQCTHPNLEGGEKSLIYFAEIAKLQEEEYINKIASASKENLQDDLLRQIWRNSQIVSLKYASLKRAGSSIIFGTLPWAVLLAGSSIKNFRFPVLP